MARHKWHDADGGGDVNVKHLMLHCLHQQSLQSDIAQIQHYFVNFSVQFIFVYVFTPRKFCFRLYLSVDYSKTNRKIGME